MFVTAHRTLHPWDGTAWYQAPDELWYVDLSLHHALLSTMITYIEHQDSGRIIAGIIAVGATYVTANELSACKEALKKN